MMKMMLEPGAAAANTKPGRPSRRRLLGGAAGGIAALSGLALATSLRAGTVRAQDGATLRGTWQAQLTRDNAPAGFGPTQFIFNFTVDGDVIAAGPSILVESGTATMFGPQLGQWLETGLNTFVFSFNTTGYGQDGTFSYIVNSRMNMALAPDGSSWTGTYVRQDSAADGAAIRSVTGTAIAQVLTLQR